MNSPNPRFILHPSSFILLFALLAAPALAWADWPHRVAVTVNNSGSAQYGYAVRLTYGAANATLFDSSEADGADWRFRKADGSDFSYWIEYWGTDTAAVLVKTDTLATGLNVFYHYFGNAEAASASNGAATCPLFQDFSTDFTVSGVADILDMHGMGVDTFPRFVMDTSIAEDRVSCTEYGNIIIPSDTTLYLTITPCCSTCDNSEDYWMYVATSPDGFTWTQKGRLDTMGGGSVDSNARGQDSWMIEWQDTLWNYYEDKRYQPARDEIGLWYSADKGDSWTAYGIVDGAGGTQIATHVNVASPVAMVAGDTLWLIIEGDGPGYRAAVSFWSLHPKGPWNTRDTLTTLYTGSHVPDNLFTVNGASYMDLHICEVDTCPNGWQHIRYQLSALMDTMFDPRVITGDSMYAYGSIFTQDVLRDCTWIAASPAPGNDNNGGVVRYRTMFVNMADAPSGWSGYQRYSTFGFNEARGGALTLAAEPWRADSSNSCIALRSDTGFVNNFVIESRMKLSWDTLYPFAVTSFGSGSPMAFNNTPVGGSHYTMTDSGYGVLYSSGTNACYLKRKPPGATAPTGQAFTIADSLLQSWRVHHLGFYDGSAGDSILHFWIDGSAARTKLYVTAKYLANSKRVLLAAGERRNRTSTNCPTGSQIQVDWLLARPFVSPEPTVSIGTQLLSADSGYVWFGTSTPITIDGNIFGYQGAASPSYRNRNFAVSESLWVGNGNAPSNVPESTYVALLHPDLSWLPDSPDTPVVITEQACSARVSAYGFSLPCSLSLHAIDKDWMLGVGNGAARSQAGCSWNHRGLTVGDTLSVCGNTLTDSTWGDPVKRWGDTPYDTVVVAAINTWAVWTDFNALAQELVTVGPESAYGIAVVRSGTVDAAWTRLYSANYTADTTLRPRFYLEGYYSYALPQGRCCYEGGDSCGVMTEAECTALSGTWTAGVTCETACPQRNESPLYYQTAPFSTAPYGQFPYSRNPYR